MELLNKTENIENLYEGIVSLYEYHRNNLLGINSDRNIFDEESVKYALVAITMLNLVFTKEKLLERGRTPKVYQEFLNDIVLMIAEYDEVFKIGDYEATSSAQVITDIRNAFAHGDFEIEDDNVILNRGKNNIYINIYKLADMVFKLTQNIKYEKNKKDYIRYTTIYDVCFNLKDFLKDNAKYNIYEMHFTRKDKNNLTMEDKQEIEKFITIYRENSMSLMAKCSGDYEERLKLNEFAFVSCATYLNNKGIFVTKNECVLDEEEKKNTKNKAVSLLNNNKQARELLQYISELKNKDYAYKNFVVRGCNYNYLLLQYIKMNNYKSIDINDVINKPEVHVITPNSTIFNCSQDLMLITSLLASICVLYNYPLDDIYNSSDGLDYSALDLSKVNPYINKPSMSEILKVKSEKNRLSKKIKNCMEQSEMIKNQTEFIEDKYKLLNLKQKLIKLNEEYDALIEQLATTQDNYNYLKQNYGKENYVKNRNIIEGIRNAISHNNVSIDKFYDNIYDSKIGFINKYKNQILLDLTVSLKDLESIISPDNIDVLLKLCCNKQKIKRK